MVNSVFQYLISTLESHNILNTLDHRNEMENEKNITPRNAKCLIQKEYFAVTGHNKGIKIIYRYMEYLMKEIKAECLLYFFFLVLT